MNNQEVSQQKIALPGNGKIFFSPLLGRNIKIIGSSYIRLHECGGECDCFKRIEFKHEVIERLLDYIEESFGIRPTSITLTPDGSSIADLPPNEEAIEKLSELIGCKIRGDESLYALVGYLAFNLREIA